MEWYNILTLIVGALGGAAGFVGIYKAKSERTGIDIGNMQNMLTAALKQYADLKKEFDEDKEKREKDRKEEHEYVVSLRNDVMTLTDKVNRLERSVTQAYRCRYPENIQDCPVIKDYEKRHCEECAAGHA